MNYVLLSTIGAVFMGTLAFFVRMKAAAKPTSVKKIILPPVFMSSGALMYVVPQFRLTPMEILEAVVVGMFFSIFLIKTSKFEIRDNDIYLKRSKAFVFILVGLLLIRIVLKSILSSTIDVGQLSGMFFLLAFSMIVPWRVAMYRSYKKLYKELHGIKLL
ncbi:MULTISPECIES: CcdC family protein [Neobacillus]|uniref:Cytochrome c biogenesis protein CcdC n=1 Tax=Neobacillus rhizophilus TaxID=2833579 RepID=A0A942TZJ9_9BACI|nr:MULTISPECIES: cytochrome c biogenesis protein CcdC [Neobacillus]MBS4211720.1 cytochrome c biogenesis protein CcdC [Neobacillus rhizophilus]MBU8919470.1 cytochrome c biogenesis protein CcdC [Bacillus sp. FJAT-29953]